MTGPPGDPGRAGAPWGADGMLDAFRDGDVDAARRQGGLVDLPGNRSLVLPQIFGFCGGVVRALAMLAECLEGRRGRTVRLLGPVIHNDTVNQWFHRRGADILAEDRVGDILEVGGPDDIVVIPAFGVPLELAEALAQRYPPGQIVDTTCHDVQAVWQFLERLEGSDWTILIHGKPEHPETRATLSRARRRARRAVVLRGPEDTEPACQALRSGSWQDLPAAQRHEADPPPPADGPVALVNQTTMLYSETSALAERLAAACRDAGRLCRVADSVCRATQDRQDAARRVCATYPDLVLVVGGFTSSNTAQLHRLARGYAPAYRIENALALSPERITHWLPGTGPQESSAWLPPGWRRIGLLAGASCPARDVGDVVRWFQRLCQPQAVHGGPADTGRDVAGEPEGKPKTEREKRESGGSDET